MHTVLLALTAAGLAGAADPPADLKAALPDADRAFAKATADKGLLGWVSFMAEDVAKTRRPGEKLTVGKEAVRKADAEIFADPTKRLVWEPVDAHAYADGKTGVTSGRYKVVSADRDGKEVVLSAGGYVTVWRHGEGRLLEGDLRHRQPGPAGQEVIHPDQSRARSGGE